MSLGLINSPRWKELEFITGNNHHFGEHAAGWVRQRFSGQPQLWKCLVSEQRFPYCFLYWNLDLPALHQLTSVDSSIPGCGGTLTQVIPIFLCIIWHCESMSMGGWNSHGSENLSYNKTAVQPLLQSGSSYGVD